MTDMGLRDTIENNKTSGRIRDDRTCKSVQIQHPRLDVGVVGRWSRLVWGLLILIPIVNAVTSPGAALEIVPGAPIRLGSGGFYLQG